MRWLLNLAYLGLLLAASPLLIYRGVRYAKYRTGWRERLWGLVPPLEPSDRDDASQVDELQKPCDQRVVWLHAVSLGEVHLLEPLVRRLQQRQPAWRLVISTTTRTGAEAAARKFPDLHRISCPLDFSWAVDTAIRRIQPDLLVLAELELWPNLIGAAKRSGARVAVVNGRLSDRSFRGYQRIRALVRWVLGQLDLVCAQNETYANRFEQLGASSVVVSGSLKFDGAVTDRANAQTQSLKQLVALPADARVFLAGSTQDPEERLAVETFLQLRESHPNLHLLIAPRHPERFDAVAQLLTDLQVPFRRRSELPSGGDDAATRVLLLDAMGELRGWWGLSEIAYVGGSMGKREGQNMIEPAAYGAAVSFGPRTANFREVVASLLNQDAAEVVADGPQLTAFVERCLQRPEWAAEVGRRAQAVVQSQLGAADATVERLERLIMRPSVSGSTRRSAA